MESPEEASRYFQRAGMLLYLVYAFDGIDFHVENVVANGEYPVPIDLETFFHHRMKNPKEVQEATSAAYEAIQDSVLRTHFLPQLYKMENQFLDISGMGAIPGQESTVEVLTWQHMNTDAMAFNYEKVKPDFWKNAPKMKEEYLSPENFIGEILGGFRYMHQLLGETKETLFATEHLFTRLFQQEARFVFRGTVVYGSLHNQSIHPDYQREGIDLSIQLDILSRSLLLQNEKPQLWPVLREEHFSMWQLDVPKFTASGHSDSLPLGSGEVIQHCFFGVAC